MCCLFYISWADIEIEKVLETTSVLDYNQWVSKNKTSFPGLKPVLVDYTVSLEESPMTICEIHYYTEQGDEISKEIVEDSLTDILVPMTNDRVFFFRSGAKGNIYENVVKNAKGEIVFTVPHGISYIGMDIYIEALEEDSGPKTEVDVLNGEGQTVGKLRDCYCVDHSRLCIADDERYAVFACCFGYVGKPIILMNEDGQEMWRRMFEGSIGSLFISSDGTKIGVHHDKYVSICNEDGTLSREYNPFDQGGPQASALSENGQCLVTVRGSSICYFNNEDGSLLWKNDTALAEDKGRVRFLGIIGNGAVIVAICWSHNLYVLNGEGDLVFKRNLKLGMEWVPVASDPSKKIEKLTKSWDAEFLGDYVIITKGRIGTRIEPLTRIVYGIIHD